MSAKVAVKADAELLTLLKPVLLPDETVAVMANGEFAPLDYHDSLTQFFLRLRGKTRSHAFVVAVSDKRLRWLELGRNGVVTVHRDYRLPLKGRLVIQRRGVIELLLPGEPRRFLTFADPAKAAALYQLVDDQQQATQRAHADTPESVGVGVKPALAKSTFESGEHGQTTVLQHELVGEIRPSFRPSGRA